MALVEICGRSLRGAFPPDLLIWGPNRGLKLSSRLQIRSTPSLEVVFVSRSLPSLSSVIGNDLLDSSASSPSSADLDALKSPTNTICQTLIAPIGRSSPKLHLLVSYASLLLSARIITESLYLSLPSFSRTANNWPSLKSTLHSPPPLVLTTAPTASIVLHLSRFS